MNLTPLYNTLHVSRTCKLFGIYDLFIIIKIYLNCDWEFVFNCVFIVLWWRIWWRVIRFISVSFCVLWLWQILLISVTQSLNKRVIDDLFLITILFFFYWNLGLWNRDSFKKVKSTPEILNKFCQVIYFDNFVQKCTNCYDFTSSFEQNMMKLDFYCYLTFVPCLRLTF